MDDCKKDIILIDLTGEWEKERVQEMVAPAVIFFFLKYVEGYMVYLILRKFLPCRLGAIYGITTDAVTFCI
ncbi:hypothetical protein [Pseudoneobacillus sp. C159]